MLIDLRTTDEGMSCEDFTTLMVAGVSIPASVRELIERHRRQCDYHRSREFAKSVLGTPTTSEIDQAARDILARLVSK